MWKEIQILERPYFINCCFSENNVKFSLYDHNDASLWSETVELSDLLKKVKLLNRRYEFSEKNTRETLTEGQLQTAEWKEPPDHVSSIAKSGSRILKLKYSVKNCPFNYELQLKKQTMQELQSTFVKPLLSVLLGCHEQIEILTDNLKKKDAEILQYRREGAILTRKTLATKLFDFEEFKKKYESNNKLVADFNELGKLIVNAEPTKVNRAPKSPAAGNDKPKDVEANAKGESASRNLKQRKRKHQKRLQMLANLEVRQKNLQYQSSQSQTFSSSQSADDNANSASNSPSQKTKSDSRDQDIIRQRRTSRCAPIEETNEKKSSDDKSDSESDDEPISPRKRKAGTSNQSLQTNSPKKASHKDTNTKDSEKIKKKEASGRDNIEEKSSNTTKSTPKDNTESKEEPLKSARKEDPKSLNSQTQKEIPKTCNNSTTKDNGNVKQMEVCSKDVMKQQNNNINTIDSIEISGSDSDDITLTSLRNRKSRQIQDSPINFAKKDEPIKDKDKTTNREVSGKEDDTNRKNSSNSLDISDTESEDIILTPRKKKTTASINNNSTKNKGGTKKKKKKKDVGRAEESDTDTDESSDCVVEISEESEWSESPSTPRRGRRKRNIMPQEQPTTVSSPSFKLKSRITRSSPQVLSTPKIDSDKTLHRRISKLLQSEMNGKVNGNSMDGDSYSKPLALVEISTQLESIRKELESLEALRLADMKRRKA